MQPKSDLPAIPFGNPAGVEIINHGRKLHMYSVTDNELNSLQESGLSATIDLALFALSVGILATLMVTLSTVPIDGAKTFAAYIAATLVSGIFSVHFGLRSFIAVKNARRKLREIKQT